MEASLMPQVLEAFEKIAATYGKMKKTQEARLTTLQQGEEIEKGVERRFQKVKAELVELMEAVHLNNARIESLVEQLNDLNRKLLGFEGQILRYALKSRIKREEFLENYYGAELDPNWLARVGKLVGKGLMSFSKWLGLGDYKLSKNTIVGVGGSVPTMHSENDSVVIRHREYIGDIMSSNSFSTVQVPLNPGLVTSFPWLSKLAQCYQTYRIHGMVIEYIPELSEVAANELSLGYVTLAAQYRTDLPAFPSNAMALESEFAVSGKPNEPKVLAIDCKPSMSAFNKWYVRTSAAYTGDVKTFDFVSLNVLVGGMQTANQSAGQIWASYEIELFHPTAFLDPSLLYFAIHDQPSNTTVTGTAPLGNSNVVAYANSISGSLALYRLQSSIATAAAGDGYYTTSSGTSATIALPRGVMGTYMVRISYNTAGTAGYSFFSTPSYTNCSPYAAVVGSSYLVVSGTTTNGMAIFAPITISAQQASTGQALITFSGGTLTLPATPYCDILITPTA